MSGVIDSNERLSGGCLCGAVRFETQGPPLWTAHCHCRDCRRTTGSPLTTYAGFAHAKFAFAKGQPAAYQSSPGVKRGFCGACGTPLTYEGARWPGEIHVFVCAFDDPARFAPKAHVYVSEQVPWLHLGDALPRFDKTPSAAS